jgi:hypothetical protein
VRKKKKGGTRLRPGMRTREYIDNDKMRNDTDEKRTGIPITVSVGLQLGPRGWPNLDGSLHSHIPMAAMSER